MSYVDRFTSWQFMKTGAIGMGLTGGRKFFLTVGTLLAMSDLDVLSDTEREEICISTGYCCKQIGIVLSTCFDQNLSTC